MVWFQCDDCGENLKKPKLANHFRGCSAEQLSCIDCGVVFNQQSVQGHTQCVSEAEKYGPKNTGSFRSDAIKPLIKQQNCDDIEVSRGLSSRAPWSCSLCNVMATSQETLMLHSQGKKHRSKVRAAAIKDNATCAGQLGALVTVVSVDQQANLDECLSTVPSDHGLRQIVAADNLKQESSFPKEAIAWSECSQKHHRGAAGTSGVGAGSAIGEQPQNHQKKRKSEVRSESKQALMGMKLSQVESSARSGCGTYVEERSSKKQKIDLVFGQSAVRNWSSSVKWKKIIRRTLKNAPDGSLKMKQLSNSVLPLVVKVVKKFDLKVSKESFIRELGRQIQMHAMFILDGKRVRLAVKDQGK